MSIIHHTRGLPLFDEIDVCRNRHRGSPESLAAQFRRAPKASEQRARVLAEIAAAGTAGLTVDELAARWGCGPNAISGRFSELKAAGDIVLCARRETRTGSVAAAFRAVSSALSAASCATGLV